MRLIVLDEAHEEAERAAAWYDEKRTGLGDDFLDDLEKTLAKVAADPLRFPRYEARRIRVEVRRALFERFSHIAVFQIVADVIYVLSICHSSQRPAYWRKRVIDL